MATMRCRSSLPPPSLETLRKRLISRGTDSMEDITNRLNKAEFEIEHGVYFDEKVINDVLDDAVEQVRKLIFDFVN